MKRRAFLALGGRLGLGAAIGRVLAAGVAAEQGAEKAAPVVRDVVARAIVVDDIVVTDEAIYGVTKSGLVGWNLSPPARALYPVLTPLLNRIGR